MADGFDQFATALQGFGAGVSGQLPQFLEQQGRQKQRTALSNQKARETEAERQKTLLVDGSKMFRFAQQGNFQAVRDLAAARLNESQNFPGVDFSDTANILDAAQKAQAGDPNAQQKLTAFLKRGADLAVGLGVVDEPKPGEAFTLSPGQTRFGPGGEVVATGGEKKPTGRDVLSQVQSSQILPNGSTVQVFKDGSTRVTGPQGRVLTGQERQTAVEDAQEFGIDVQSRRAGGRTGATETEKRAGALITRGIAAAESTATIRRALTLLETVKTGGLQAISLAAKQRLGIEGANEGELSNSLGKAVLSQLRETFGAAFTESEGLRLERIEASFGKSAPTNRRLLQQALRIAERTSNRAIKAAEKRGNQAEAADIRDLLSFTLDVEQDQPEQQQPTAQQQPVQRLVFDPATGQLVPK